MLQVLMVSTSDVARFLQIAGLISLPIVVLTFSFITWLHYRKRKKEHHIKNLEIMNGFQEEITEQHYLQDMLSEKQAQLDFVQNQLSQRIRSFHELEAQQRESVQQLDAIGQVVKELNIHSSQMKEELAAKNQQLEHLEANLQRQLEHSDVRERHIQELMGEKNQYIKQTELLKEQLQKKELLLSGIFEQLKNALPDAGNTIIKLENFSAVSASNDLVAVGA